MIYFLMAGRTPASRQAKAARLMNYISRESYTVTLAVSSAGAHPDRAPEQHDPFDHPPEEQEQIGIDPAGVRMSWG